MLKQVTIASVRTVFCGSNRNYATQKLLEGGGLKYAVLKNRGLFRISGVDALNFLQGLVTNDMTYLAAEAGQAQHRSLYALLLNTQGRVMHDLIIHNCTTEKDPKTDLLVECDRNTEQELGKILLKYNLRRKVDFCAVETHI